jgi:putative FmdB family regulatory protein
VSVPIYEYECKKCKHRFERIQKFSDPPIKKCPSCNGGRVEKLLSPPAVHFKGSGWYVTDYARKGAGKKGKDKDDKEIGKKASTGSSSSESASTTQDKKKS